MNYRKIIIIMTVVSVVIMMSLTGITYAYYNYDIGNNTIGSSVEDIDISYKQGNFISNSFIPINDRYSSTYANKYDFDVIVDKKYNNYEIGLLVDLIDIEMDKEFDNWLSYLKYELVDTFDNKVILNGDFTGKDNNILNLNSNMFILDTNYLNSNNRCYKSEKCVYKYELRIWLSDICENSNDVKTCPNYLKQLEEYNNKYCVKNDKEYDCSKALTSFVYNNAQNELQNKKISMKLRVNTGLRK